MIEDAGGAEIFALAHRCGKSVAQVLDWPASEIDGWRRYFANLDRKGVTHGPNR